MVPDEKIQLFKRLENRSLELNFYPHDKFPYANATHNYDGKKSSESCCLHHCTLLNNCDDFPLCW